MITNEEVIKYLIAPTATSTEPSAEYLKQKAAYDLAIKALEEVEELKEENHRNFVNSQHIISSLIEEIKKLRNEKG